MCIERSLSPKMFQTHKFVCRASMSKVVSYLQWAKCCRDNLGGKKPLFINMDETSISFHYGRQKGLVVSRHHLPPDRTHNKETVKTEDAKAHISFLAFFTHETDVQPKLPQIFIGNKHKFLLGLLKGLAPHTPHNFLLWREESSWNNVALMRKAMCQLMKNLKDLVATHQVILVLDCARCHIHPTICTLATRLGIRLLYVPARLTWLLQPADTHGFGRLKHRLRKKWLDLCIQSSSGQVSHLDWLAALFEVTRKLLCEVQWRSAFESNGLLGEEKLGHRILTELEWGGPRLMISDILTQDQLKVVLPQRTKMDRSSLFKWAMPKAAVKSKAKAKPKAKVVPGGPISSRTRKTKAPALD